MELIKVTDRIYYTHFEVERDRPLLGYIRGDRLCLAVDAGHSAAHTEEFYEALKKEGLPLPDLTVLTHWHWDHTFGLHAIHGVSVSSRRTAEHLREILNAYGDSIEQHFLSLDEHIRAEYAGGERITVRTPDMEYQGELTIDLGGVHACLFEAPSAHTDDSTLVYVPEEKTLFFGDAICGEFPTWKVDPFRMSALTGVVEDIDFVHALTGHWEAWTKDEVLDHMKEEIMENAAEKTADNCRGIIPREEYLKNAGKAREEMEKNGYTCVLRSEEEMLCSKEHGVRPLLVWIRAGKDLKEYSAADQIVGKAAALLYAKMGVRAVNTKLLSEKAIPVLERYGILYEADETAPYIINRAGNGMCPMEQTVTQIEDPDQAVEALARKVVELSGRALE